MDHTGVGRVPKRFKATNLWKASTIWRFLYSMKLN